MIVAGVQYLTQGTITVLELLLAAGGQPTALIDLVARSGERRPTVMRVMQRLLDGGRVVAGFDGRRRVYTLTGDAAVWAQRLLHERTLPAATRRRLKRSALAPV